MGEVFGRKHMKDTNPEMRRKIEKEVDQYDKLMDLVAASKVVHSEPKPAESLPFDDS